MILTNPHNQRTQLLVECCLQLLEDHREGHGAGLWLEFHTGPIISMLKSIQGQS